MDDLFAEEQSKLEIFQAIDVLLDRHFEKLNACQIQKREIDDEIKLLTKRMEHFNEERVNHQVMMQKKARSTAANEEDNKVTAKLLKKGAKLGVLI